MKIRAFIFLHSCACLQVLLHAECVDDCTAMVTVTLIVIVSVSNNAFGNLETRGLIPVLTFTELSVNLWTNTLSHALYCLAYPSIANLHDSTIINDLHCQTHLL